MTGNPSNVFAILLPTMLLAGCSGGSPMTTTSNVPPPTTVEFAFVTNLNSNTVSALEVESSGMLVRVGSFPTGDGPEFIAADSSGGFLFVANTASNDLSVFQIDGTTGVLTAVAGSPVAVGAQPEGVAVVSGVNLLFVANTAGNSISAFNFDPMSGALSPVPGSPFTGVAAPFGVATDIRLGLRRTQTDRSFTWGTTCRTPCRRSMSIR
jgi:DNA-binding beta-propeller fold protein YncE